LARGRFASLWRDDGTALRLTASELALFIEGCSLVGRRALSPEPIAIKPLVSDRGL
jgi:transposase